MSRAFRSLIRRIRFLPWVVWILLPLTSCGLSKDGDDNVIKECYIPEDQSGTISGHWQGNPVPIAFHQGDWDQVELAEMTAAAETWNAFFALSKDGLSMVDYGGDRLSPRTSSLSTPDTSCSSSIITGSTFSGSVVIYKLTSWPNTYPSSAMAITQFCRTSATPYQSFFNAWILVNYQYFWSSGKKVPDLQTIVLHELGHVLGLNHSCEDGGGTGMPNCSSTSLPSSYKDALMYPSFSFNSSNYGEQKRSVRENDQYRVNCLY